MLETFRSFFRSTLGVVVTLTVLALIALAFAAADVSNSGGFGGVAGGDRVAMVGHEKIGTAQLVKEAQQALEVARQQTPGISMKAFLAGGGLDDTLNQLMDRTAIVEFGKVHGIVAGKRLIDSELAKLPQLQGPDGKFSESNYRALLAQRQLTDAEVRADIAGGLIAKQVLMPADYGASMPAAAVGQYAALLKEHRVGGVAILPSLAFAPKGLPTDAEVNAFYTAHTAAFMLPERRIVRYAVFGQDAIKTITPPSEADIAARYNANRAQYAASESRTITQLIVPAEADAKALAAAGNLSAAAKAKGLSTATVGPVTRDALAQQTSPEIAAAVFAAHPGATIGPIKGALGWTIAHLDKVDVKAARSLAQAHDEIAAALLVQRQRAALADATARIDDSFGKGTSLADAAKSLGLTPQTTAAITSDGKVYGEPGQSAPAQIAKIIPTAFQMEREGAPQLAELDPGKTFVMFDVTQITAAAPAPLAMVKPAVMQAIAMQKGATAAHTAAQQVQAEVRKGKDLATAVHDVAAATGVTLPPVQPLALGREDLTKFKGQIPAPLSLFFGMAQGTAKLLPADGGRGWSVVQVSAIQPGTIAPNDPLVADTARELSQLAGNELAEELRNAIRADVGVKRNETAIHAVAQQLAGN